MREIVEWLTQPQASMPGGLFVLNCVAWRAAIPARHALQESNERTRRDWDGVDIERCGLGYRVHIAQAVLIRSGVSVPLIPILPEFGLRPCKKPAGGAFAWRIACDQRGNGWCT